VSGGIYYSQRLSGLLSVSEKLRVKGHEKRLLVHGSSKQVEQRNFADCLCVSNNCPEENATMSTHLRHF